MMPKSAPFAAILAVVGGLALGCSERTEDDAIQDEARLAEPGQGMRCVQRCGQRYDDGSCAAGAADYCANEATCVPRPSRYADGSVKSYGEDFCASGAVVCVPHVSERFYDGSVKDHGEDFCGAGPVVCILHVTERFYDGSIKGYGADVCGSGRAPECIPRCVERHPDGTCLAYGEDVCS